MKFDISDAHKMTVATLPVSMKEFTFVFDADDEMNDKIIVALIKSLGENTVKLILVRFGMAKAYSDADKIISRVRFRLFDVDNNAALDKVTS